MGDTIVDHALELGNPVSLTKLKALADQYLDNITLWQAKINLEEEKLMLLIERYPAEMDAIEIVEEE